jgi:membrane protease YdiL (CAAX protease family)
MATTLSAAEVAARRLDLPRVHGPLTFRRVTATAAVAATAALPGGPLGEEPGWRGCALPLLQRRRSPLTASLAIGLAPVTAAATSTHANTDCAVSATVNGPT